MILSDRDIEEALERGRLEVRTLGPNSIQPASIDLRLGSEFMTWPRSQMTVFQPGVIDFKDSTRLMPHMVPFSASPAPYDYVELLPGRFALATTEESVRLDPTLCARVEGRSSIGRLGLVVHATAGFIDPGFEGKITLELFNMSPHIMRLRPGQSICQLAISRMLRASERPYGADRGSKYQNQNGVTASRWKGRDGDH